MGYESSCSTKRPAPRGFTLVELLVVIAIIGVLVGLLVVAIGRAQVTVREGVIATEIANLSQAVQLLKNDYGAFPPDFSNVASNKQAVDQYLAGKFRYRTPTPKGSNANNPAFGDAAPLRPDGRQRMFEDLDPAEALVFWLQGFSSDPQRPIGGNTDRTPVFEFDKARLGDRDNDGWQEYYPRFADVPKYDAAGNFTGGQGKPYVYYESNTYVFNFGVNATMRNNNLFISRLGASLGTNQIPAPRPYLSTQTIDPPDASTKAGFAESNGFQIISAGLDNDYGIPVPNAAPAYYVFAFPKGPYPDNNKAHLDNITNFSNGTLGKSVP
ncbi:MAG: type II secretion system protein [Planctomycetales bacterium]|nr:type II secretion system protein [Planctomycetales bacterium]